jgi:hypothetical protein
MNKFPIVFETHSLEMISDDYRSYSSAKTDSFIKLTELFPIIYKVYFHRIGLCVIIKYMFN